MKTIYIDTAEPKKIDDIFIKKGYNVIRSRILPSGDYAFGTQMIRHVDKGQNNMLIKKGVIIERKDVSDFDSSFANGSIRLWQQLEKMQEVASDDIRTYYAIVGDISKINTHAKIYPKQRVSAIGSAMARYPNVPITTFSSSHSSYEDLEMFVDFIDKLYRSYYEGKFGVGRTIGFKKSIHKSFDEYVLSGISGISQERANDILQHFDIEYNIIPKEPKRLSNVLSIRGIGHKTWSAIKKEMKLQ
jgi:ERCC4-type nuclease|tara:strand:- start:745 stop:1479 length:735 start_codon:yes stop_codon:yes gene_type:complete